MSPDHTFNLSGGRQIIKRRVFKSHLKTIWISSGAPSATNFAWDRPSFQGTSSLLPTWGLRPRKFTSRAVVSQLQVVCQVCKQ